MCSSASGGPSLQELAKRIAGKTGTASSGGETSSGGVGFGLPATTKSQPSRMQRTASAANFMALFGAQPGA